MVKGNWPHKRLQICWRKDGGKIGLRVSVKQRQGHSELAWSTKTSWKSRGLPSRSVPTRASGRTAVAKTAILFRRTGQKIPVQNTQLINAAEGARKHSSYRLFEEVPLLQGQRVGLGDDGDDVDHLTEAPHELHIQWPQTGGRRRQLQIAFCNHQEGPQDGSHGLHFNSPNCVLFINLKGRRCSQPTSRGPQTYIWIH